MRPPTDSLVGDTRLELLQQSLRKRGIPPDRDARCAELGAVDADLGELIALAPAPPRGACRVRSCPQNSAHKNRAPEKHGVTQDGNRTTFHSSPGQTSSRLRRARGKVVKEMWG